MIGVKALTDFTNTQLGTKVGCDRLVQSNFNVGDLLHLGFVVTQRATINQNIGLTNVFTLKIRTAHKTEFLFSKSDLIEVCATSGLEYKT